MTKPPSDPPLAEPAPAPEIYVDGYASVSVTNGVARLTFFSVQHRPDVDLQSHERRVVLRLAASMPTLVGIHQALGNFLSQIENVEAEQGNA